MRLLAVACVVAAFGISVATGAATLRRASGIPLGATPPAVRHFCVVRARLRAFPVLCPLRYPVASHSDVTGSGSAWRRSSFYWASFNDMAGFPHGDLGHLVLGGQRPPFSLVGATGKTWPRPGQRKPVQRLGLPRLITVPMRNGKTYIAQRPARIIARARIRGTSALVLSAAAHPEGGLLSSHVIIIWNEGHHGYFVSPHFAVSPKGTRYTLTERIGAALAIARSSRTTR